VIYVGLDLATSTGWAVLGANGEHLASGTWTLAQRGDSYGARWLRLRARLRETLDAFGDDDAAVGYEFVEQTHESRPAAIVYGGLVSAMTTLLDERGVPYVAQKVGDVKRHATGKGNASKDAVVAAAVERWDFEPSSHDEADALWIADVTRAEMEGEA